MIGELLCRMHWHRYEFRTMVEDSAYGHEFVTRCRCRREECPQHLWWALCDAEMAHPDIPARIVHDTKGAE